MSDDFYIRFNRFTTKAELLEKMEEIPRQDILLVAGWIRNKTTYSVPMGGTKDQLLYSLSKVPLGVLKGAVLAVLPVEEETLIEDSGDDDENDSEETDEEEDDNDGDDDEESDDESDEDGDSEEDESQYEDNDDDDPPKPGKKRGKSKIYLTKG